MKKEHKEFVFKELNPKIIELCGKSEKLFIEQDGEFLVSHPEFKKYNRWWRRLYRWYRRWLME